MPEEINGAICSNCLCGDPDLRSRSAVPARADPVNILSGSVFMEGPAETSDL